MRYVRSSADPDDITAQINPIGVPWLKIGEEPLAVPNGGSARGLSDLVHHSASPSIDVVGAA
jgi:hypothetical protein